MRRWRRGVFSLALILSIFFGRVPSSHAGPTKEIVLTATYGVLAGSIVGLATLAFTGDPGGHLRNIAMGASIGLYCGIALGIYVAYGLPALEKMSKEEPKDVPAEEGGGLLEDEKKKEGTLPQEPPKDSPDLNKEGGEPGTPQGGLNFHPPVISVIPVPESGGKLGWAAYADIVRLEF